MRYAGTSLVVLLRAAGFPVASPADPFFLSHVLAAICMHFPRQTELVPGLGYRPLHPRRQAVSSFSPALQCPLPVADSDVRHFSVQRPQGFPHRLNCSQEYPYPEHDHFRSP
ncbi:hypothetical protein MES4922_260086 [Mesorhizobium ventifaucium]|uniref:Secreted protein n=1 Tax=Mesorhizobium ventifaucium TaxID=666020 RepID=A0ABM9DVS5_9HYPH|nr:hypothetical protein MES4922_260086 [Mesorhizobium ventifaucium]